MATDKRTYPNSYFAWFNDDSRIAILQEDSETSGAVTREKYDSYSGATVTSGLRVHFHSKYETATAVTQDLYTNIGVDTGLQKSILDYVKCRFYENIGDLEKSSYHMKLYENAINKWPGRKSGVRRLAVPRL